MSAPTSAYRTEKLKTYNAGVTVEHSIAIPTDAASTLKSRFYLDYLFNLQPASGSGIIGGCLTGSDNYNHHSTSRIGSLRSYNGGTVVYFNDAGLNTKGNAIVTATDYTDYYEGVVFTVDYKSAYYEGSTGHGYDYSIDSAYYGALTFSESVSANSTITKNFAIQGAQPNQWIHFKGININAEGTYLSPSYSVQVPYLPWSVSGNTTYASQASGGTVYTFYAATLPIDIGTIVYPDTTQGSSNTHINGNYYCDSVYWFKLSDNTGSPSAILEMGILGSWPLDDPNYEPPASDWSVISIQHYESGTWSDGCAVMDTVMENATTIYQYIPSGEYYASQSLSGGYATDGVYFDGTTAPDPYPANTYEFFILSSGVIVNGGNCWDGITY